MTAGTNGAGNPGGTNSQGSEPQAGNPPQSGNGSETTGQPQAGNQGANTQTGNTDISQVLSRLESLDNEVKATRRENQNLRKRLKGLGSDDDTNTDGKGSANGSPNPEVLEALAKLRTGRTKDQLTAAATKAGAYAPDTIWRMLDDLGEVADDEGNVKNPDKVMADIRKAYPAYFKPVVEGDGDGGKGNRNNNPQDMNAIIRGGFQRLRGQSA